MHFSNQFRSPEQILGEWPNTEMISIGCYNELNINLYLNKAGYIVTADHNRFNINNFFFQRGFAPTPLLHWVYIKNFLILLQSANRL